MEAYDDALLRRYLAVKSLAERTTVEGEKQNALRMLERMEQQYPEIAEQATILQDVQNYQENAQQAPPPSESHQQSVHWTEWFANKQKKERFQQQSATFAEQASSVFTWAANFANHAMGFSEARSVAHTMVEIKSKHNPSGSLTVNVKLPPGVYGYCKDGMNDDQRTVLVRIIAERLAEELFVQLSD
jgi:hypothetical protein